MCDVGVCTSHKVGKIGPVYESASGYECGSGQS